MDQTIAHARAFLTSLGLDLTTPHLTDTPQRMARMYHTLFNQREPVSFTTFPAEGDDMIVVGDIPVVSWCSHHLLPFVGKAYVGYLPTDRICGLSKIPRIVEWHARQPQVQERLTHQIASDLDERLHPKGVAVVLRCTHSCMEIRGVRAVGAVTTTSSLTGPFLENSAARDEFLQFIRFAGL
jgi:GTP cyclohydrolase I